MLVEPEDVMYKGNRECSYYEIFTCYGTLYWDNNVKSVEAMHVKFKIYDMNNVNKIRLSYSGDKKIK